MPTKKQPPTFEQSMTRLEEIVAALEKGDASLEESLALFEEGAGLLKGCSAALDQAEQKVAQLFPGPDGAPVEAPLEDLPHDL